MKSLATLIIGMNFTFSAPVNADVVPPTMCNNSINFSTRETANSCYLESRARQMSYLPRWISENISLCELISDHSIEECLTGVVKNAVEILSCEGNQKRIQEMAKYDESLFSGFVNQYGSAKVPAPVQARFQVLVTAAQTLFPQIKSLQIPLAGYKAPYMNAHAGASNRVLASAGLWATGSPLSLDEITAILAHEIGHVVRAHSLKMGCLALEWTGADLTMADAMVTFREEFSIENERGQVWSRLSIAIEYEADRLSSLLLKQAGFNPRIMAQALGKLRPKTKGGFSSGSHPEFDERIQAAEDYARTIQP